MTAMTHEIALIYFRNVIPTARRRLKSRRCLVPIVGNVFGLRAAFGDSCPGCSGVSEVFGLGDPLEQVLVGRGDPLVEFLDGHAEVACGRLAKDHVARSGRRGQ